MMYYILGCLIAGLCGVVSGMILQSCRLAARADRELEGFDLPAGSRKHVLQDREFWSEV